MRFAWCVVPSGASGQAIGSLGRCIAMLLALVSSATQAASVSAIDTAVLSTAGEPQRVALPDSWNRHGRSGTGEYRLAFRLAAKPVVPWAAYVPRIGNRGAVYLNGRLVKQVGQMDDERSDYVNRPQLIGLPAEALVEGENELRLVVQGEKARYAGLSTVYVGAESELLPRFLFREALQLWGSFAVVVISALFAVMAGMTALRTRDRAFVLFAAACVFCALRTSYAIFIHPPVEYRLWAAALDACYAGYLACLCLFCVDALAMRWRWVSGATTVLLCTSAVLVPLYAWGRIALAREILLAVMLVYALVLCGAFVARWLASRTTPSAWIAAAGVVSCVLALHDHIVVLRLPDGYDNVALARYSLMIFVVAMGALLVDRYVGQMRQGVVLHQEVRLELESKRRELEEHFDRQQLLASRNAQQQERERLMQDLHDGMGLQLTGLLGIVQDKPLERSELTLEVRTAIEQMRMLLDSSVPFDGDLSILLGHIRYRIEHRLQQRGIVLDWNVDLAHPERAVATEHAIALQRLVFELVTNTLKHSGATRATVSATDREPGGAVHLVYADDGKGFANSPAAHGFGTRSIQRRIADLGARLEVSAQPGQGVRYDITTGVFAEGERPMSNAADDAAAGAARSPGPLLPSSG